MLHFLAWHHSLSLCIQQSIIRHWESIHRHLCSALSSVERVCLGSWWGGWHFPCRGLKAGRLKLTIFQSARKKGGEGGETGVVGGEFFPAGTPLFLLHHLFRSMIGKMAAVFFSHFLKIARLKSGDGDSWINTGFTNFGGRFRVMSSAFLSSGCWIALNHYFCHIVLNKIYSVNNIIGMKGIAIKLIY